MSQREAIAVAFWAAICIAVTVLAVDDHFSPLIFALYIPAQVLLGVVIPHRRAVPAPLILFWVLGVVAYLDACPCYENDVGFFLLLWAVLFALPGMALVALGVAVGERVRPALTSE